MGNAHRAGRPGPPRERLDEGAARAAICEAAREIWLRGLGGAGDGNLSVRLDARRILTTPSACHKGHLDPEDLVIVDLQGRTVVAARGRKPSSELVLHLAAYAARDEIGAVIHAHPPAAVALELAGVPLSQIYVSEVVFAFGLPATAPYTTPTTDEVGRVLQEYLRCYDVVLMPRHGSVTVGASLDEAVLRLDALEHSAKIAWMAHAIGAPKPIAPTEIAHLHRVAGRPPVDVGASGCPPLEPSRARRDAANADAGATGPSAAPARAAAVEAALVEAVLAALRKGDS